MAAEPRSDPGDALLVAEESDVGPLAKALAIPLAPFVAGWEGGRAFVTRTLPWAAGILGRTLAPVVRGIGKVASLIGRGAAWVWRAAWRPFVVVASALLSALRWLGRPFRLLLSRLLAVARIAAKALASSMRHLGRVVVALLRRVGVSVRSALRAMAILVRARTHRSATTAPQLLRLHDAPRRSPTADRCPHHRYGGLEQPPQGWTTRQSSIGRTRVRRR